MDEPADLTRFRRAQDDGGIYERALDELQHGRKTSHWMWFVLPQLTGLGRSGTAQYFALAGLDEARAFLADDVLGPRLRECCDALLALPGADPVAVLGPVDALKLRSSMTLFARADPSDPRFTDVLDKYFGGVPDETTDRLLT